MDEEGVCCCGLDGLWGVFDGAPNLEPGLLSFAMPLLHIVDAADNAGRALRVGAAEAHLETAAGWARRKAARESMMADVWSFSRPRPGRRKEENEIQVSNQLCRITAQTIALLREGRAREQSREVEWIRFLQAEPSRQVISSP